MAHSGILPSEHRRLSAKNDLRRWDQARWNRTAPQTGTTSLWFARGPSPQPDGQATKLFGTNLSSPMIEHDRRRTSCTIFLRASRALPRLKGISLFIVPNSRNRPTESL